MLCSTCTKHSHSNMERLHHMALKHPLRHRRLYYAPNWNDRCCSPGTQTHLGHGPGHFQELGSILCPDEELCMDHLRSWVRTGKNSDCKVDGAHRQTGGRCTMPGLSGTLTGDADASWGSGCLPRLQPWWKRPVKDTEKRIRPANREDMKRSWWR